MTHQVPKKQTVAAIPELKGPVEIRDDFPVTQPSQLKPGQCLIKLICTGVCHTDLHISKGEWPIKPELPVTPETPLVGGHEGIGIVAAIADHTDDSPVKLGQRVGVKWIAYSCGNCEPCRVGLEQNCRNVKISGLSREAIGTFSQYVVSWVHNVTPIPDTIEDNFYVAPLLCAGVTVYRAIKLSGAKIGDWIAVPGAGGGLGHLAVQYATAMGLRVVAIGNGEKKKKLSLELGAKEWVDYKEHVEPGQLAKKVQDICDKLGAHSAIVTASGGDAYVQAVEYLRPGGTVMAVGVPPNSTLGVSTFSAVAKNISIEGCCVGNRQDTIEAIEIAALEKMKVIYETRNLTELQQAYGDLAGGKVAGRLVLDVSK